VEGIINKANDVKQNELWCDVGLVFIVDCECIDSIRFQRDANNNLFINLYALPPILPHELVKTMASNFLRKMRQHGYRLQHRYFSGQIDLVANEHKALIRVLTWTSPEARYQCVHWKIIICWRLEFTRSLFPQFVRLLWHCHNFVSQNIHCWIQFFCVMLGEGWIP